VRRKLPQIGQLDPPGMAYRDVLRLLAAESTTTGDPASLLSRLAGLVRPADRFAPVRDSWEGQELSRMADRVLRDVPDLKAVPLPAVVDVAGVAYGPANYR